MRSRFLPGFFAVFAVLFASAQLFGATTSSFSGTTGTSGNTISAAANWSKPTVDGQALQKSEGGIVDSTRPSGQFYVYANVTDATSVSASVSSVATISTASMSAGSWTVGGQSYNYRTALLTAKSWLTTGSYSITVNATNVNGTTSASHSVAAAATTFVGGDFGWDDAGTTSGRFEPGEVVSFNYGRTVDPESIISGWDGSSTSMRVVLADSSVYGTPTDILVLANSAMTVQHPVGLVYLNGDFVASGKLLSFTGSSMVASGSAIVATLGTWDVSGNSRTITMTTPFSWTPSADAFDAFGNAASATASPSFAPVVFSTVNKTGGLTGQAEAGDSVRFEFNEPPSPESILSGWNGSSTAVTVRLSDRSPAGTSSDQLTVRTTGGTLLPLGDVLLIGDYASGGYVVNFANSSMTLSGDTVTVVLGTPGIGTRRDTGTRKPAWAPDPGIVSLFNAPVMRYTVAPATAVTLF